MIVIAQFSKKQLHVGELIEYKFTLKYPSSYEVILPDSNTNIEPFEIKKIIYTPSHINANNQIIDTVKYLITTYSLEKKLPCNFKLSFTNHKDTIVKIFDKDTLELIERIQNIDNLNIKNNYQWIHIKSTYNYRKLVLILFITALLLFIAYKIFGQSLKNRLDILKINRREKRFRNDFNKFLKELDNGYKLSIIEKALFYWKNHLTALENKPINSLTSKELVEIFPSKELEQALQTIDSRLYGGIQVGDIVNALKQLKTFVKKRYIHKRRMIITRRK
jgi:hypothetical protein